MTRAGRWYSAMPRHPGRTVFPRCLSILPKCWDSEPTPVTIPGTFPKQALLSPMALLKEKPVAVGGQDEDEEEKVVDVNKQEE